MQTITHQIGLGTYQYWRSNTQLKTREWKCTHNMRQPTTAFPFQSPIPFQSPTIPILSLLMIQWILNISIDCDRLSNGRWLLPLSNNSHTLAHTLLCVDHRVPRDTPFALGLNFVRSTPV